MFPMMGATPAASSDSSSQASQPQQMQQMQAQMMQMMQQMQAQMMQQMQQARPDGQGQQAGATASASMAMPGAMQMPMMMMPMGMMGMPGMQMMPMAMPGMPQMQMPQLPTAAAAPKPEESEPVACDLESISALEIEIDNEERAAKKTAKENNGYVGVMTRYLEEEGFGFIHCEECQREYGKDGIFINGRTFVSSDIDVGDTCSFEVTTDTKGLPRVQNPKLLKEVTRKKKHLERMKQEAQKRGIKLIAKRGGNTVSVSAAVPNAELDVAGAQMRARLKRLEQEATGMPATKKSRTDAGPG